MLGEVFLINNCHNPTLEVAASWCWVQVHQEKFRSLVHHVGWGPTSSQLQKFWEPLMLREASTIGPLSSHLISPDWVRDPCINSLCTPTPEVATSQPTWNNPTRVAVPRT